MFGLLHDRKKPRPISCVKEYPSTEWLLPDQYEHVEKRTIRGKQYAVKVDLREYLKSAGTELIRDVSWVDGSDKGTDTLIIRKVVDWDKVRAHIDKQFEGVLVQGNQ